ncbi:hypothetical protein HanIR_Chr17g0895561 [Helianthus annuus]|nr:hypothetical protein HanIR_Chr17g0895561 [Helianthus annuus]
MGQNGFGSGYRSLVNSLKLGHSLKSDSSVETSWCFQLQNQVHLLLKSTFADINSPLFCTEPHMRKNTSAESVRSELDQN